MNVFSFFSRILYFNRINLSSPLAPLRGKINICARVLFRTKFDSEQLLFEAFFWCDEIWWGSWLLTTGYYWTAENQWVTYILIPCRTSIVCLFQSVFCPCTSFISGNATKNWYSWIWKIVFYRNGNTTLFHSTFLCPLWVERGRFLHSYHYFMLPLEHLHCISTFANICSVYSKFVFLDIVHFEIGICKCKLFHWSNICMTVDTIIMNQKDFPFGL